MVLMQFNFVVAISSLALKTEFSSVTVKFQTQRIYIRSIADDSGAFTVPLQKVSVDV